MRHFRWLVLFGFMLAGVARAAGPLSSLVEECQLVDQFGNHVPDLAEGATRLWVVAFLGTECPLAKLYGPRLDRLAAEYADRGVQVVGVFSNRQDLPSEIEAYRQRLQLQFPLLVDRGAKLADRLAAERTPEVLVLDATGQVAYRGRIDDQYGVGYARQKPEREDLRLAIDSLLAGQAVDNPVTVPVGCLIGRERPTAIDTDVTFATPIASILQRHCVECHRPGEIGPFSLTEYEEAAGWADTIVEVVRDGRMPPWHASEDSPEFANKRQLTAAEQQSLADWAAAGAPSGDRSKVPALPTFIAGWRLPRQPDVVIPMRDEPFEVAAEGIVDYQYFVVDPGFTEDKWVVPADIQPGAREVLHHTIIYIAPGDVTDRRGYGWLTAYVPGQSSMVFPPGHGRLVPAGSKLVFEQHYTTTGAPMRDLTRLGLVFADPAEITHEVISLYTLNDTFEIPPRAANHKVSATLEWFPPDARLLAIAPHMHLRGKDFRATLREPTTGDRLLLAVPRYDFNWQTNYQLAAPIELDSGAAIDCVAHFDNSAANPHNPDSLQTVRWGEQSFEEMMMGFFEVAVPRGGGPAGGTTRAATVAERANADQLAADLMQLADRNRDGHIGRRELPAGFALFVLRRYDLDGDQQINPPEIARGVLRDRLLE